jgi:hypothetical protein
VSAPSLKVELRNAVGSKELSMWFLVVDEVDVVRGIGSGKHGPSRLLVTPPKNEKTSCDE